MINGMELMVKIANLYYIDNLTQDSIARRLKISKYKVNRLLKKARSEGIVQIKIINTVKSSAKL